MQLQAFFKSYPRIAVAFSGGVDSTYLIYAAKAAGCDVRAYFIKSQFQPKFELNEAVRIAGRLGVALTVDALNALDDRDVAANPPDRCYYCKKVILSRLRELARGDGYSVMCDGTNADDKESDRPGMRALREMSVLSPLRDAGLKKVEIRRLSKEAGLGTHDKPAYACLATRVPAGTPITVRLLEKIERVEEMLYDMGFSDFRARFMPPDGLKIQLPDNQLEMAITRRVGILAEIRQGFNEVVLDLTPR